MSEITNAELLSAIASAVNLRGSSIDDKSMIYTEIQAATGLSERKLRPLVREMVANGSLRVERVIRLNVLGERTSVPGYFVVDGDFSLDV
jgi:hypothetical protein